MKTQIIQLDRTDDIISVRDKMNWSQARRILLVWPPHGRPIEGQLELNLIKRHATRLGAQLALVTHSPEARFCAMQLDIPVFDDLQRAQRIHWHVKKGIGDQQGTRISRNKLEEVKQSLDQAGGARVIHPAASIVSFILGVLAVLALAVVTLPGAKIVLSPRITAQSIVLKLSEDTSPINLASVDGVLPTYYQEVIVEATESITSTGTTVIPNQAASGSLKFTNISDHAVSIPAGTVVTTYGSDPLRFTTTTQKDTVLAPGATILLNAQAQVRGRGGNLPADSLVAIEDRPGVDLTVTNPNPTDGGTDATVPAPSKHDLDSLRLRMESALRQEALAELNSKVPSADILILPSLRIKEVIEETANPAVGEPGRMLALKLRLRMQVQVVSDERLHRLAEPILNNRLPPGYQPETVKIDFSNLTSTPAGNDATPSWSVRAERDIQPIIDGRLISEEIRGRSVSTARQSIQETLPLASDPQISIFPWWWPRLPFLAMRIQVTENTGQ